MEIIPRIDIFMVCTTNVLLFSFFRRRRFDSPWVWTYLNTFYSNDDTFGSRTAIWRSPSGMTDDILRLPIANLSDRSHIDRVWGHCTLHSLDNTLSMFHDRCNICKSNAISLIYIRLKFFLQLLQCIRRNSWILYILYAWSHSIRCHTHTSVLEDTKKIFSKESVRMKFTEAIELKRVKRSG